MTFHFPADVPTNMLTSDASDPKAGTAEFKATAIQIEAIDEEGRDVGRHVGAAASGKGIR